MTSGYLDIKSWASFSKSHVDNSLPLFIDYQGEQGKRLEKKINEIPYKPNTFQLKIVCMLVSGIFFSITISDK